ncbi:hypothetical protein EDB80DRAFT_578411, partial [Ilyonectria destructans]
LSAAGQCYLIPDLNSLCLCPWDSRHGLVFCYFGMSGDGPGIHELCPRYSPHKALTAAGRLDLEILVGIEIEFCALMPLEPSPHQASSARTLDRLMGPILDEISTALEGVGIPVQHYQAEGQQDEYELTLGPMLAMRASDAYTWSMEAIRNTCARHGIVVTFHPWAPATSGMHINISVQRPSGCEDAFLSGLLSNSQREWLIDRFREQFMSAYHLIILA